MQVRCWRISAQESKLSHLSALCVSKLAFSGYKFQHLNLFSIFHLVLLIFTEMSAICTTGMLVDHQDADAGDKVFERKTGDEERGRNRNCQRRSAAFAQNVEFMQINCPLSLLLSLRSLASAVRPSVHQLSFFYVPLWLQQLLFLP